MDTDMSTSTAPTTNHTCATCGAIAPATCGNVGQCYAADVAAVAHVTRGATAKHAAPAAWTIAGDID